MTANLYINRGSHFEHLEDKQLRVIEIQKWL